jgi:hypothetical protein
MSRQNVGVARQLASAQEAAERAMEAASEAVERVAATIAATMPGTLAGGPALRRLIVLLPEPLHRHIKVSCASRGIPMSEAIRGVLSQASWPVEDA